MRQKRIVIVILALLLIISIAAVTVVLLKNNRNTSQSDAQIEEVNVTGAEEIVNYFSAATKDSINRAVAAQIEVDTGSNNGDYEISYREGSYKKTMSGSYPIVRIIVDIPKLERSYIVTAEGDETTEYSDLRVTCPSQSDLIYKPQECNDTP
jgi:hypothetical protein